MKQRTVVGLLEKVFGLKPTQQQRVQLNCMVFMDFLQIKFQNGTLKFKLMIVNVFIYVNSVEMALSTLIACLPVRNAYDYYEQDCSLCKLTR